MKRKLIKLAMCAMAVLPMGAWADVVNNATATWLFDQYGKGVQLKKVDNATEVINMDSYFDLSDDSGFDFGSNDNDFGI